MNLKGDNYPPQHLVPLPNPALSFTFLVPPKYLYKDISDSIDDSYFIQNLSEHIHISDPNPPAGTGDRNRYNNRFNFCHSL